MNNKILALAYHSVGEKPVEEVGSGLYCVSEEKFREQMDYVSTSNRSPLTAHRTPLTVTFDDGDITNYTKAFPILKEFGIKAYFFLIVSRIGRAGYMDWPQIEELVKNGMIVGSHGMTHKILTIITDEELDYELRASKQILENRLKKNIEHISVPRGLYNKKIINKAYEIGYKQVFTSNPKDNDGFKRGRIVVRNSWNFDYFMRTINNGVSFKDKLTQIAKDSARTILGDENYDKIRTKILTKSQGHKVTESQERDTGDLVTW